jgi:hypothetical protein
MGYSVTLGVTKTADCDASELRLVALPQLNSGKIGIGSDTL